MDLCLADVLRKQECIFKSNILDRLEAFNDHFPLRSECFRQQGFAFLKLTTREYYLQTFFETILESYTRFFLVSNVFEQALNKQHNFIFLEKTYDGVRPYCWNNRECDNNIGFDFIEYTDSKTIGYRYSDLPGMKQNAIHLMEKIEEYGVDEIVIIDTTSLEMACSIENYTIRPELSGLVVSKTCIKDFIISHLDETCYKQYSEFLLNAINDFKEYTGIISIPKLTPHYLFRFRFEVEHKIRTYLEYNDMYKLGRTDSLPKTYTCGYHIIDDKNKQNKYYIKLEKRSRDLLLHSNAQVRFRKQKLYRALIGKSDFAKTFITSEYLYKNYSKSDQFDYTAIVSGYLKSVEQLMLQIALFSDGQGYKIKKKKCKEKIALSSSNLDEADTTMGALDFFFQENPDTIELKDPQFRETFLNCLFCYKDECRNDSFHQHNISSWDRVELIRNNTFFIHTILLGCSRLGKNDMETTEKLKMDDDRLTRIYYQMTTHDELEYVMQFENDEKFLIGRPYEIEYEEFDEFGFLKREQLVLQGHYYCDMDNAGKDFQVKIDKNNIPLKLWMEDEHCNVISLEID